MDPRGSLWKRSLGTGYSRLCPAILLAWSSQSPFSVPLSTSNRVQSAFWSLPSLACLSFSFLPLISHNTDGSGSIVAAFYHPLPSSGAVSSSPSGKPPSFPLLVHGF